MAGVWPLDKVTVFWPNPKQAVAKMTVVDDVTVGRVRVSRNDESDPAHGHKAQVRHVILSCKARVR